MPKTTFFAIDHEEATASSAADLANDMISSFIDDVIGGSKQNSDFSMIETDLSILHKEVKQKYKEMSLTKPMRLFKIKISIEAEEVGKDLDA